MTIAVRPIVEVRRTHRTWSVYVDDRLVEGGFFRREPAERCAAHHRRELHARAQTERDKERGS